MLDNELAGSVVRARARNHRTYRRVLLFNAPAAPVVSIEGDGAEGCDGPDPDAPASAGAPGSSCGDSSVGERPSRGGANHGTAAPGSKRSIVDGLMLSRLSKGRAAHRNESKQRYGA